MVTYYVTGDSEGRFWIQHTDENGETWDADPEGFDTREEAEEFLAIIQDDQPHE